MNNVKLKPFVSVPVRTGIACNAAKARAYGESHKYDPNRGAGKTALFGLFSAALPLRQQSPDVQFASAPVVYPVHKRFN